MKYFLMIFIYASFAHGCAREKVTAIQIQNYDGPIYISPPCNQWGYDNQCSQQPLYHIQYCPNQAYETDCTCITKSVPLNTVAHPCCTTCSQAPPYLQVPTCLQAPPCLQQGSYSSPYFLGYQDNQEYCSVDNARPQIPYARYLNTDLGSLSCGLQQPKYANQNNCQCGYKYSGCY